MRSLWHIGQDFEALDDLLHESGGEITGCEAAIESWYQELDSDVRGKFDNTAGFIGALIARAEARKNERERLRKLESADLKLAERLKERLRDFMVERGIKTVDTDRYKITVRKPGGMPALTISEEIEKIPSRYLERKTTYVILKDVIRDDLNAGEKLDFAKFEPRSMQLSIR